MRSRLQVVYSCILLLFCVNSLFAQANFFTPVDPSRLTQAVEATKHIQKIRVSRLNEPAMRSYLLNAPLEFANNGAILPIEIPLPNGQTETFGIVESPILSPEIAAQHPEIKTYTGNGLIHNEYIIRFNLTANGFSAILLHVEDDAVYFESYSKADRDLYFSYFTRDAVVPTAYREKAFCGVKDGLTPSPFFDPQQQASSRNNTGADLRTFRLAFAVTGEFTVLKGGQVASFAALTGYVDRLTALYRTELSVTFMLVSGNNLVYTDPATDPYNNLTDDTTLDQNQMNIDNVITAANYDVGFVLGYAGTGTSGGGYASSPVVCATGDKAKGAATEGGTPYTQVFFDQTVFHEIGHMFSMSHSYNSSIPVCTTREPATSVEPGAGATIMSYGFTCDNADAGQGPVGNDNYFSSTTDGPVLYFHTVNYSQAVAYIASQTCQVTTATGNNPPVVTMPGSFTIPKSTPFALTGSATDPNGNPLTYSWEGTDPGTSTPDAGTLDNTTQPPFFRSYEPMSTPTRTFPLLASILDGTNQAKGDKLPSVGIVTNHRLTVRDNVADGGGVSFGTTAVTVDGGIGPFLVTSNLAASYPSLSSQTITWSVNGTNAATPLVNILLSTDSGLSFPITLAAATANDGTESVSLLSPATIGATARIKVEAVGNIFFDISNANFTITAPLPVELVRFDVSLKGENDALLTWQTATEVNNQGYDVEMAINDGTFRKMGFVKGQGTSNVASNYEFTIPNLVRGVYYFRLKMKDLNGAFEYSPLRSLALGGVKDVVNVYPNPVVNGVLDVTLTQSDAAQLQAELINAVGQLISTTPFVNDGNIMRLQLPSSGVYHLVLRLDNGIVITRKVVRL